MVKLDEDKYILKGNNDEHSHPGFPAEVIGEDINKYKTYWYLRFHTIEGFVSIKFISFIKCKSKTSKVMIISLYIFLTTDKSKQTNV